MVDSVKNYGIAGVGANVELGKAGSRLVGSSSDITLQKNNGSLARAEILAGTESDQAVTKAQLDSASDNKLRISNHTLNYNSGGPITLCTVTAGTRILNVTVEKGVGNWTNASSTTEITIGDAVDADRLFTGFDYEGAQSTDVSDYLYASQTDIVATVTPGGATAGTAKVSIQYAGNLA